MLGSPPPSRGLLIKSSATCFCLRITPALAGTTSLTFWVRNPFQDHPPPSRGLQYNYLHLFGSSGITPALAGTTFIITDCSCGVKDHPRPRGDYQVTEYFFCPCWGSPPPSRGLQELLLYQDDPFGITPALAGTTFIE